MRDKIVTLKVPARDVPSARPQDGWHSQIAARLTGIERLMRRLEWQVWGLACSATGLLALELLRRLARA